MSYGYGERGETVCEGDCNYHTVIEKWTGKGEPPEGESLKWTLFIGLAYEKMPLIEIESGHADTVQECLEASQRARNEHREI